MNDNGETPTDERPEGRRGFQKGSGRHTVLESFFILSRSIAVLCLAMFFLVAGFLLISNPAFNVVLKARMDNEEKRMIDEKFWKLKDWNYDLWSDVDISTKSYPIVVLREGFKVIRFGADKSLVGWQYDIANTSKSNGYSLTIEYKLLDGDGFLVASGNGTERVGAQRFGTVRGTIYVDNADLDRIGSSSWTIQLFPGWESLEREVKGSRYDRLAGMLDENTPPWISDEAQKEMLAKLVEKWGVIRKALVPNVGEVQAK